MTAKDPTFRNYTAEQAKSYSESRHGYPDQLLRHIVSHHQQTGGQLGRVLDLGCGPGLATRDLAKFFDHAIGVDPGATMIDAAQQVGGRCKDGTAIEYHVGTAEACDSVVPAGSVDLITAATSAHWFDMDQFWPAAARLLKPKGTVAIFNIYRMFCHPARTPHADEVQRLLSELEYETLMPYTMPGNVMIMEGLKDLEMPWSLADKCTSFDESTSVRQGWNEDNRPDGEGKYYSEERVSTFDELELGLGTVSAVTRWREAHPDLAGTSEDCVISTLRKIREIVGPEVHKISMVGPTVLLLLKRSNCS